MFISNIINIFIYYQLSHLFGIVFQYHPSRNFYNIIIFIVLHSYPPLILFTTYRLGLQVTGLMKSGQMDPTMVLKLSMSGMPLTRTSFGRLYLKERRNKVREGVGRSVGKYSPYMSNCFCVCFVSAHTASGTTRLSYFLKSDMTSHQYIVYLI